MWILIVKLNHEKENAHTQRDIVHWNEFMAKSWYAYRNKCRACVTAKRLTDVVMKTVAETLRPVPNKNQKIISSIEMKRVTWQKTKKMKYLCAAFLRFGKRSNQIVLSGEWRVLITTLRFIHALVSQTSSYQRINIDMMTTLTRSSQIRTRY